jgi:3-hydroxyacyl-CoA dehydrogenase/enoyl-CoA hydratase/3-hydroxybutyryl-CoA epimerase
MGIGFPPFRGGPFHHVDQVGAATVVGRLEQLAADHGPRYAPAEPLLDAAKNSALFFPAGGGSNQE